MRLVPIENFAMNIFRLLVASVLFSGFPVELHSQALIGLAEVQVSTGTSGSLQFAFDGGLNEDSAQQTLDRNGSALSEASSMLDANGYVPTLRTRATASPTRAQAVAWGVQGYRNDTGGTIDTTLSLDLSANVSGSNDIDARVYLFKSAGFEFYKDSGTMLFESSSQLWDGFEPFANNLGPDGFDIDINDFTGSIDEQRTFDFSIDPGESFYVWARLLSTANNPGVVDAYSTLTASLSNTQGLTPALVPEPSTFLLILVGGVGCLFWSKRSRS